jgi:cysteinyl-tRNA synthetase
MLVQVYNSLTKKKEEFIPLEKGKVSMYVCGITAYDRAHIGHARAALVFDIIYRFLRYLGYEVTYVRNYTDVDDKIIKRANQEGVSCQEIAERYIKEYAEDMQNLGMERPTYEPRATAHIPQIIELIKKLMAKGFAYQMNGDVYFAVEKFGGYGKLSGRSLEEMRAGARVEVDERKNNPLDFALWKASKPGEPSWDSPWGKGRPGWHIECSAMSQCYLGETFDIHGGGQDLIFPHHENEIAQSEAASGKPFVRYWLHNGFVNINKEKMSKSLGNILPIRDLLQTYEGEVVRLFLLSTHYRSPVDFSLASMTEARLSLDRFYATLHEIEKITGGQDAYPLPPLSSLSLPLRELHEKITQTKEKFLAAMADDFNTALALGYLHELIRSLNRGLTQKNLLPDAATLSIFQMGRRTILEIGRILGLWQMDPVVYFARQKKRFLESRGLKEEEISSLIAQRDAARQSRNWALADQLRAQAVQWGIILEDGPTGTTWKPA